MKRAERTNETIDVCCATCRWWVWEI